MSDTATSRFDVPETPNVSKHMFQLSRILHLSQMLERMMCEIIYCLDERDKQERNERFIKLSGNDLGTVWREFKKLKLAGIADDDVLTERIDFFIDERNFYIHYFMKIELKRIPLLVSDTLVSSSSLLLDFLKHSANYMSETLELFDSRVYRQYESKINEHNEIVRYIEGSAHVAVKRFDDLLLAKLSEKAQKNRPSGWQHI